ncbi:MAG: imidazole glycerol phosphate synthase subunit HisH [Rhodospirillaceae bacterium]|nr:MAG: imidazole glycerol phosphate synthase subunit HisH [Rhodospirillaceae bacterium]
MSTTVAIIDYGRGNVRSVANALEYCGADTIVTADPRAIDDASHIVLPGVGAFGDAMAALQSRGLPEILHRQVFDKRKPFLGICLGMQLLADRGLEHGEHAGLGWIKGEVVRLEPGADALKIPHMGWNDVVVKSVHPLFAGVRPEALTFYFVHSYHFRAGQSDTVLATCDYGGPFTAAVAKDNMVATQFHPEKSQDSGIELLENFVKWNP